MLHLWAWSDYMLRDNTYTNLFLSYDFYVRHQTSSKIKFKNWPETYKTVLGSAIFIYVYICFWNLKNWSLPTKSLSIQHEGNSICFGNRFLENRVDFRWFFDRFSQIKTNFSENANFYKILNFDQFWLVTKKLLKWKGLRNM